MSKIAILIFKQELPGLNYHILISTRYSTIDIDIQATPLGDHEYAT